MCSFYFSSVWVADWPTVGKELLTRLTLCSLCILTTVFVILVISRFGFEGLIWVLIASVPGLCTLFTFKILPSKPKLEIIRKDNIKYADGKPSEQAVFQLKLSAQT